MNDVTSIVNEKQKMLTLDEKSLQSPALVDKLIQKCVTIQDFLRSLEARINKFGAQVRSHLNMGAFFLLAPSIFLSHTYLRLNLAGMLTWLA